MQICDALDVAEFDIDRQANSRPCWQCAHIPV